MKKMKSGFLHRNQLLSVLTILFGLVMLTILSAVSVSAEDKQLLYDYYGLLSDEEEQQLEEKLDQIADQYHFEPCILIKDNYSGYYDDRETAAEFMQNYEIGYGSSHEGMILYHQPSERSVTLVFRGDAQYEFDSEVQDKMLGYCTARMKDGDYIGAYESVLNSLASALDRVQNGQSVRPMDLSGTPLYLMLLKYLAIAFGIAAIPTFCMTFWQVRRMKTNVPQQDADQYASGHGINLTVSRDMFLYRSVTKVPKPKNNNNSGGPGGGGFSHGGESFSGSSRRY